MTLSDVLDMLTVVALGAGALFAGYQLADLRRQRRREGVFAMVRSFQSADFSSALRQINSLPDGADRAAMRALLGPTGESDAFLIGLTWESVGVLVFRGEIDIETVDDFFSGAIAISWRKLRTFVEEDRSALQRATVWEWFQWLAERSGEQEALSAPVPAHIAHREWRPRRSAIRR